MIDYNKKYGRLKVLNKSPDHQYKYTCICDCGNIVDVIGWNLTSGRTTSCGCVKGYKVNFEIKPFIDNINPNDITYKQAVDESLYYRKTKLKAANQTLTHNKKIYDMFVCLNDIPIKKIDTDMIGSIMDLYLDDRYKFSYFKTIKSCFNILFNYCVFKCYITTNPLDDYRSKKQRNTSDRSYWTVEQFLSFRESFKDCERKQKLIYDLMALTGMRPQEVVVIKPKDIDLDEHSIHIKRAYDFDTGEIKNTKTNVERITGIPNMLKKELEEYYKFYEIDSNSNDLLFKSIPSRSYIRYHFVKHYKMCNLPKMSVYQLRHLHASFLLSSPNSASVSFISAVAKRLGNSQRVLINTYTHSQTSQRDLDNTIDELLKIDV